ncbi:MAG: hypothetical protein K8S13_03525 [Desulfobacula sp.]|uniref:hypothetical protein n=1 Tax=Desulfobacula sp. TaxID=2593537 RepID=UPI0025BA5E52|nr:hypothetical protein [Desulfobacula sp.]MCD4718914.1 hypothetical protein [Desulfobacula sp.]
MKRILSVFFLIFTLCLTGNATAAVSSYTYLLDIDIPDPGMIIEVESMIGGVEFKVSGGVYGDDWTISLGNAVPVDQGVWIFENFGTWNALYDNYNWSDPDYAPMISGNVLTITSGVELMFTDMGFYDFRGQSVNTEYFSSNGFTQSAIPIPGSIILLGSGLLGFLSVTRRK